MADNERKKRRKRILLWLVYPVALAATAGGGYYATQHGDHHQASKADKATWVAPKKSSSSSSKKDGSKGTSSSSSSIEDAVADAFAAVNSSSSSLGSESAKSGKVQSIDDLLNLPTEKTITDSLKTPETNKLLALVDDLADQKDTSKADQQKVQTGTLVALGNTNAATSDQGTTTTAPVTLPDDNGTVATTDGGNAGTSTTGGSSTTTSDNTGATTSKPDYSKGDYDTTTGSVSFGDKDEVPTLSVPQSSTINQGDAFNAMDGVSATDNEDGDLTSKIETVGYVNTNNPGTYTYNYSVVDSGGNTVTKRRVIKVVQVKPTLSVPGLVQLTTGDSFSPMVGVSAKDAAGNSLTDQVTMRSNVDTSHEGTYGVEYNVVDADGHAATATMKVHVIGKDATFTGLENTVITQGDTFDANAGVTVDDPFIGTSTNFKAEGNVDTSTPGSYTETYTYTDQYGHTTTADRHVMVAVKPALASATEAGE